MTGDTILKLLRDTPLGLALGVVALLLAYEAAKKWVPDLLEWLAKLLYRALAGTRLGQGRMLKQYRARIMEEHGEMSLLFAPEHRLQVASVYVPLHPMDGVGTTRIVDSRRAVVVGPPGAGKSMLLRHSLLSWAANPTGSRVPVLVELRRCNANTLPLTELIADQFRRDGLPRPDRLGRLCVLFDGLDEVNSADRERVSDLIRDYARAHPGHRVVVTCRSAIYNRQLLPEFRDVYRLAEFEDRHIRRFLRNWPLISGKAQVDRLLSALAGSPRVLQLARNPLLLTMIAFLYGRSDTGRVLPHSRAEFYEVATQELLSRLKHEANRFSGPAKKAVLERLALLAQDAPGLEADRRTLPFEVVLRETAALLPGLNLAESEAGALITEIAHRSGLLLAVDGGQHYQFAHLSLQEYFAASALADDQEGLLERYRRAPSEWLETAKLWCGIVSKDSSPVVAAISEISTYDAIACLADAVRVDNVVADTITESALQGLDKASGAFRAVPMGLAAADPRQRGRRLRKRLFELLNAEDRTLRMVAALCLANTNLPEVARRLGAAEDSWVQLVTMGNMAVPVLAEHAATNSRAVELLRMIGTPEAAVALAELVWRDDDTARKAAWSLAYMVSDPEIEAALVAIPPRESDHGHANWVWAPYRAQPRNGHADVLGRVARIIDRDEDFVDGIDIRFALPLVAVRLSEVVNSAEFGAERREDLLKGRRPVSETLREHPAWTHKWDTLLHCLPEEMRLQLIERDIATGTHTLILTGDWSWAFEPQDVHFRFWRSWRSWLTIALGLVIGLTAMAAVPELGIPGTVWPWVARAGCLLAVPLLLGMSAGKDTDLHDGPLSVQLCTLGMIVLTVLACITAHHQLGAWAVPIPIAATMAGFWFSLNGRVMDRQARNPLRGLLDQPARPPESSPSVIG
ncbi:NACHT domain-containing protein [Pseudonocardiaceae bacterium YIM PH 21723]|nr:NACHT domain-containing protein [Pseudonocardiaceae bacterium YIM PH 21723]